MAVDKFFAKVELHTADPQQHNRRNVHGWRNTTAGDTATTTTHSADEMRWSFERLSNEIFFALVDVMTREGICRGEPCESLWSFER